jgi:hypothetical protein
MKKTLIFLLLSLPLLGIAQTTNREFPPKESGKVQKDPSKREPYSNNFDTVTVEKTKRIVLTQKANNKLINQYMGKIVGTTNKADQLGNYASFDPALGSLAFKGSIPIGSPENTRFSYLGIGLNGDLVSNGFAALFNNSKLNTNIGIQLDYNFRLWKPVIFRDEGVFRDYESKIAWLQQSTRRKFAKLPDSNQVYIDYFSDLKDVARLGSDIEFYKEEIKKAKRISDSLNRERILNLNQTESLNATNKKFKELQSGDISASEKAEYGKKISLNNHKLDSLKQQTKDSQKSYNTADFIYEQHIAKLKEVKKNYDPIKQKTDSVAVLVEILSYQYDIWRNKILDGMKKVEDSLFTKLEFRGLNINYFTILASTSQKEYYTFDKKLPFGSQLAKQAFTTYKFGLAWNSYNVHIANNQYVFYRIAASYLRDNNTDQLSTMPLAQEVVFKNSVGDTTRKVAKTYNVYTDPLTTNRKFNLSTDFYYLFGKRTSGFHLAASYFKPEKLKHYTDVSAGYLVSFQSLKKEDPLINVEVYYKFADIYDNRETGIDFWQRNEIGFKVGLPFALLKK